MSLSVLHAVYSVLTNFRKILVKSLYLRPKSDSLTVPPKLPLQSIFLSVSLERRVGAVCLSLYRCMSVCVSLSVCVVESYTREAGVRTLERRIGAVCRAVAVKVAEHLRTVSQSVADQAGSAVNGGKQQLEEEASETVDIMNVSSLTVPPKLPIVIDVAAVEDILGVCSH